MTDQFSSAPLTIPVPSGCPSESGAPKPGRISYSQPPSAKAPVPLLKLEHHHCRWPIGDPKSPDFGFCGDYRVPGRSYCAVHVKRAKG